MIFEKKTNRLFVYTGLGWLGLGLFFITGYPAAMFCRDLILLGYIPPASQAEFVRQVTMLILAIASYVFYLLFAFSVMGPIAKRKWPEKQLISAEEKHEINNRRFFFTMIPSILLIIVMAAWDLVMMAPFPGTEWIYQSVANFINAMSS